MSVTRLCYQLTAGTNMIDIARDLSVALRTHKIHQKSVFTVVGGMVVDNPGTSQSVELMTAPNTWYMKSAINRAFAHWKKYRHRVLTESGQVPSKFADFRINLSSAGSASYRYAKNADRENLALEEWNYSVIENDAGVAKSFQIVGDHSPSRYACMKGWLETRPTPTNASEPVMPDLNSDAVLDYTIDFLVTEDGTNDNITDQVIDVVEENDERPYTLLQAYGPDINNADNLQSQCFVYVSDNNPTQMIPGFQALCGLVRVDCGNEVTQPLLYIDVLNTPEGF